MTFAEWAETWLEAYKKGIVKDNTYWGTYHNPVVKHLIPYFGDRSLNEIKPLDIQLFFRSLTDSYSLETQKKIRAALKSIYETAIENDLCSKNPITKSLKLKSNIQEVSKSAYTQNQALKLKNFCLEHPQGLSIALLLETGISRSELLGINRYTDFDSDNSIIYINNGTVLQKDLQTNKLKIVTQGLKNKYRRRAIPVGKSLNHKILETCEQLNEMERVMGKQITYLIASPRGYAYSPDNWYKRTYCKVLTEFIDQNPDIPFLTPHELRHTWASLSHEREIDLLDLAYMGGWTDLEMLRKRYAHIDVSKLKERCNIE